MLDHIEGIGPLDVQSTKENAFSDQDLSILQIVAGQLAVAIENAFAFLNREGGFVAWKVFSVIFCQKDTAWDFYNLIS